MSLKKLFHKYGAIREYSLGERKVNTATRRDKIASAREGGKEMLVTIDEEEVEGE
jgi:hypothetical protein